MKKTYAGFFVYKKYINKDKFSMLSSILFLLFTFPNIQAQDFSPIKAPDAVAFSNANYLPVDESTGHVDITIPIHTIDLVGMEIPLSISYDTGGVKVNSAASNIGLNWTLNGVGLINKEIQGQEDIGVRGGFNDYTPTGFLYTQYGYLRHLLQFNPPASPHDISEGLRDTKPDLYYVMAPGISTKFVHRYNGTPLELVNTGVKIESPFMTTNEFVNPYWRFGFKPEFMKFKITNINGFEYDFEEHGFHFSRQINGLDETLTVPLEDVPLLDANMTLDELQQRFYPSGIYINNTLRESPDLFPVMYLKSIKNPVSKRSVKYIYENNNIIENNRHTSGFFTSSLNYNETNVLYDFTVEKIIKKIIFPNGVINFYYKDRLDVRSGKVLKKIDVLNNNGKLIKAVVFEHDYFRSIEDCTDNHCYRLRLNSVHFVDKNHNTLPGYSFEYNTTKLPKRFSLDQDFTGYYNGPSDVNGENHIPKVYIKEGEGENTIIPFPFKGYTKMYVNSNVDKTPNIVYSRAGVLEKIIYPTGSHMLLDYELHSFGFKNTTINSGGLRIKKQSIFNSSNVLQREINYDYNMDNGISSGSITSIPSYVSGRYAPTNNSTNNSGNFLTYQQINSKLELTKGKYVTYSRVKVSEVNNGYIIKQYTNVNDKPNENTTSFVNYGSSLPSNSFVYINIAQGLWPVFYKDNSFKRGQLISLHTYDNEDNLLRSVVNEYEYPLYDSFNIKENHSSTISSSTGNVQYVSFELPINSESSLLKKTRITEHKASGDFFNEVNNVYVINKPFIREKQAVINGGNIIKEIIYYPFDSEVSNFPNMNNLDNLNIIVPVKKQYFKNNEILETSLTTYEDFGSGKILPLKQGISKGTNSIEDKSVFISYDKRGNITEYKKANSKAIIVLWGYDYQYKVAEVLNTNITSILSALNASDTEYLQTMSNIELEAEMSNLRKNLPNAQVYSYTHAPGIGVLSITDPRGQKNIYEYDSFNRLIFVKDNEGNILSKTNYNYKLTPSVEIPDIGLLNLEIQESNTPDYVPNSAPSIQYTELLANVTGGKGDYSFEWKEVGSSIILSKLYKYIAEVPCGTSKEFSVNVIDLNGTSITKNITVKAPNCGEPFYVGEILGFSSTNNQNNFWVEQPEGGSYEGLFSYLWSIVGNTSGVTTPTIYYDNYYPKSSGMMRNTTGKPVTVILQVKVTDLENGLSVYRSRTVVIEPEFEINSCFVAGTKIIMSNGKQKEIENVRVGDKVLTFNIKTNTTEVGEVENIATPNHTKFIILNFENGIENTNTLDHPYYIKGKGWSSYSPEMTKIKYGLAVSKIMKGDIVLYYDRKLKKIKETSIISLKLISKTQKTYNLDKVSKNHNFFANGVLVHNKSNDINLKNK